VKLGRIVSPDGIQFAARMSDQDPWTPFASLGTQVTTTAEAIALAETMRERLGAGAPGTLASDAATACPVVAPTKMLAVGLNYLDHIRETGAKRPERPVIFAKYPSALTGPRDPILHDPRLTDELDYEAELAVVIGRRARRLTHQNALDAVFGYTVANDVSARDWQRADGQLSRSKSYDTFCPVGPWITTADEVEDPQSLPIRSWVNAEPRQDSTTGEMVFSVRDILVHLSTTMTLFPGDVVLTGTPHGVGLGFRPPRFLSMGDVVRCEIDGLGAIENAVTPDGPEQPSDPLP
jgi:2-keto-4-pentenoate hydratase/2-oxohepta-3-ene-1,7-dioic acid hydratase in catechol pathway